jgi:hypothetical protein
MAKKKKVKEDIKEDVKEESDKDESSKDSEESKGGFDDINSPILGTSGVSRSWHGQSLEEFVDKNKIEKDWKSEEEFIEEDAYSVAPEREDDSNREEKDSVTKDFYGTNSGSDFYSEDGGKFYDEVGRKKNGAYDPMKNEGREYNPENSRIRSRGEIEEGRRERKRGRSMLEVAGFEDQSKQRFTDVRGKIKYDVGQG